MYRPMINGFRKTSASEVGKLVVMTSYVVRRSETITCQFLSKLSFIFFWVVHCAGGEGGGRAFGVQAYSHILRREVSNTNYGNSPQRSRLPTSCTLLSPGSRHAHCILRFLILCFIIETAPCHECCKDALRVVVRWTERLDTMI